MVARYAVLFRVVVKYSYDGITMGVGNTLGGDHEILRQHLRSWLLEVHKYVLLKAEGWLQVNLFLVEAGKPMRDSVGGRIGRCVASQN